MPKSEEEYEEDREKILSRLEDMDELITPSHLRINHTDYNNYHKFIDNILNPLMEEGEVVKIPSSTKGELIVASTNLPNIIGEATDNSGLVNKVKKAIST